jgi:hypothetical protein
VPPASSPEAQIDVQAIKARCLSEAEFFPGTFDGYDYLGQTLRLAASTIDVQAREIAALREELEEGRRDSRLVTESKDLAWDKVDALTAALAEATKRAEQAEAWSELCTRGKSPCGHWKAYSHTEDGGKNIDCWQCHAERSDAALDEARSKTELRDRELDTMSRIATKYQKERDEARKERDEAMAAAPCPHDDVLFSRCRRCGLEV